MHMPMQKIDCLFCDDTGWICANHPDQPWQGVHACMGFHPDEGD
jgi:hypothetical protein